MRDLGIVTSLNALVSAEQIQLNRRRLCCQLDDFPAQQTLEPLAGRRAHLETVFCTRFFLMVAYMLFRSIFPL